MDTALQPAFQGLLSALVIAAVTILVYFVRLGTTKLIAYLDAKIGESNTAVLKSMATTIVRALQQSPAFQALAGEQKKELAIIQIVQWAEGKKLPIDREYIDRLIEEAVQAMKTEAGQ